MQNNPEIEQIVDEAVRIARTKKHEYVLTEHVLLSMIRHVAFRKVLEKYGTDVPMFEAELDAYLDSLVNLVKLGKIPGQKDELVAQNRAVGPMIFVEVLKQDLHVPQHPHCLFGLTGFVVD